MRVVVVSGRSALVVMMQSTEVINLDDTAAISRLDFSVVGAIRPQGLVSSPASGAEWETSLFMVCLSHW